MPVVIYKPVSKTPLEMIQKYKKEHPDLCDKRIGYAGRLDPMAEGLLLMLVGDENKEKEKFENLEKEYEFTILFGFETDTYDVMGLFVENEVRNSTVDLRGIKEAAKKFVGTWRQEYPPYSSVTVNSKPLYWWARQKRLNEIDIPFKEITVKSIDVLRTGGQTLHRSASEIIKRIENTHGDFRQLEIIEQWRLVRERQSNVRYALADCRIVCSSGTYVRALCQDLGAALKVPALAYSIRRTRIGSFTLPSP